MKKFGISFIIRLRQAQAQISSIQKGLIFNEKTMIAPFDFTTKIKIERKKIKQKTKKAKNSI